MKKCPKCNSDDYTSIVHEISFSELIETLITEKKILVEEYSKDDTSKWICNQCNNRWGEK